MHVKVACCCNFLGDENEDESDGDSEENDDGDDDDDDDSSENGGVRTFDELISGFKTGKTASPQVGSIPGNIMHGCRIFVFI